MCQTAAFAAASHFRRLTATPRRRRAAAIDNSHRRPRIAATTVLVMMTTLAASMLPTVAVPAQGETSSLPSPVLPLCPAGTHLEPTSMTECLPCLSGVSFTATVNRKTECFECLRCPGLIVESPCNATHNTVCRCPPGHYLNVDGGCTILSPRSGNGTDSSAKSSIAIDAAVNRDEEGRSCEKESPLAVLNTALLCITLVGITVLIIKTIISSNVNCNCCKWRSKSLRRLSRSNVEDPSAVPLVGQRITVSGLSNGTQTDEPRTTQSNGTQTYEHRTTQPNGTQTDEPRTTQQNGTQTDEPSNTQLNVLFCAEVQAKLDKEAAEHAHTKEMLEAKEKLLASYQLSRADDIATLDQLRFEVTSCLEQVRAAVVELQKGKRRASIETNAYLAETPSESGSDSVRQVTDNSTRLTEARHGDPCIAEIEASRVTASVESLRRRIKRILEQSDASNVAHVILIELEAFSKNPYGYFQTSPTDAEDPEARTPLMNGRQRIFNTI